ncbi:methyltransferase [Lacibacterium aquatile]|uniref:Methyltransferase n=1 Tax=Lacibacterium aquatile TaxID=1168082 RepID=A0ABW5DPX0_9PROT
MRTIPQLVTDIYGSLALLTAMQIDLFTPLGDGPLNIDDLAAKLDIAPNRLQRLVNLLIAEGLLMEQADGRLANGEEANRTLVKGRPHYRGGAHEAYTAAWSACLKTAESLSSGRPAAPLEFDGSDLERAKAVLRGLAPQAVSGATEMLKRLDLSSHHHLLDIGGGSGALSLSLLAALPGLTATVVDIPAIIPAAQEMLAEEPQADRCHILAGDALQGPLPPHDLAVMRNFLQLFGPDDIRRALKTCRAAIAPDGRLCVFGYVLDDDRRGPPMALGADMLFLNYYAEGAAYTRADYSSWLDEAGFTVAAMHSIPGGQTLIVAVPH